ncbi:MAG TPA: hypothetical protein VH518_13775 [Tepidisphaeraceae bacterium]|jgi:hypothetical protein
MKKVITINGVEYSSVQQMPPDARREYDRVMALLADKNGNGVPDLLENGAASGQAKVTIASARYIVDGKEYESLDQIPAPLRSLLASRTGPDSLAALATQAPDGFIVRLNWTNFIAFVAAAIVTALFTWIFFR